MAKEITITLEKEKGELYPSKLKAVKLIKEYSGLGLKEAKWIMDELESKPKTEFQILRSISTIGLISEFKESGYIAKIDDRDKKMKRVLYMDTKNLMFDMLSDMGKWEKFVGAEDKENLSFVKCKEIAANNIISKYDEYIQSEYIHVLYDDIHRINNLETKSLGDKYIKFNEEMGEMSAEVLKMKGLTYKPYSKDNLIEEMADTLQCLFSIFNQIGDEAGISLSDVLTQIPVKNIKWEAKISEYKTKTRV